jgi:hypothetical protein
VLAFAGLWFVTRRERRTTAALKTHMPHDAAGVRLLTRKGAKKGFFHHRKKKKLFSFWGFVDGRREPERIARDI